MGEMCGVCRHPQRLDIDRDILGLAGAKLTQTEIGHKYGLGRGVIQRHIHNNHVSRVISAVAEEVTILHGNGLLMELAQLYETANRILVQAENAKDLKTALTAIKEMRGTIETFSRIGLSLAKGETEKGSDSDRSALDDAIDEALKKRHAALMAAPDDDDGVVEAVVVE